MKIVVIGAGQGGLSAAYGLAKGGHDVTVYEKSEESKLCYDWHDDMTHEVFKELDISLPQQKEYFTKGNWSFNAPFSDKWIKINQDPEKLDWSIERRALSKILVNRAREAGAKFVFETEVSRLIIDGTTVKGVVVLGEQILADLTIDSSGALSKFRASLPVNFGIQREPKREEIFYVYRAFHERREGSNWPETHTNKAYLKHLGRNGISWCIADPAGQANVLIGSVGGLKKKDFEAAMAHLKEDNEILGEKVLRGGQICVVPIRYPLSKMVADGLAIIGDAAFMTIPMLGSGMASSIRAGAYLADTVNASNSAKIEDLWQYQVKFMRNIGAQHISVDIMKRWLLSADNEDLRYVMDNGIVDEDDLKPASLGERIVLSPGRMMQKLKKGWRKMPVLLALKLVLDKGTRGYKTAMKIPKKYVEKEATYWQQKMDALFGN